MSHELNPREVLSYLNELGYTNITAHQLKDFMTDLKILMKYDNRLRNPPPTEPEPTRDVFEELYSTGTIASNAKLSTGVSNAKLSKQKEHVISVQVHRPRSCPAQPINVQRTKVPSPPPSSVRSTTSLPADKLDAGPSSTDTCKCTCSGHSTARSRGTIELGKKEHMPTEHGEVFSKEEIMKNQSNMKKNKENRVKSFIRPRLNTRPPRSDPVALYHQYQEHWKKQKIPGTSNHPQLRWMIREKLLGEKNAYCY